MTLDHIVIASAATIIWGAVIIRTRPLLRLQRGATYARAAGMLLSDMAAGAWARRVRWSEHVQKARREA